MVVQGCVLKLQKIGKDVAMALQSSKYEVITLDESNSSFDRVQKLS